MLTFHSNHSNHGSHSFTISEINGDFSRNSQNFPINPVYLAPPLKGARCRKNYNNGATGPRKKFDDNFGCLDTISERDGQQRPRLRIASRGKNWIILILVHLLVLYRYCCWCYGKSGVNKSTTGETLRLWLTSGSRMEQGVLCLQISALRTQISVGQNSVIIRLEPPAVAGLLSVAYICRKIWGVRVS